MAEPRKPDVRLTALAVAAVWVEDLAEAAE
jgi:hypothetical protein